MNITDKQVQEHLELLVRKKYRPHFRISTDFAKGTTSFHKLEKKKNDKRVNACCLCFSLPGLLAARGISLVNFFKAALLSF